MLGNVIGRGMTIGTADHSPGFPRHDRLLHRKVAARVAGIAGGSPACVFFDHSAAVALDTIRVHHRIDMICLGIHCRMADTAVPNYNRSQAARCIRKQLVTVHTLLGDQRMVSPLVNQLAMTSQAIPDNNRDQFAIHIPDHLMAINTLPAQVT
jgi:hypothetical protein